MANILGKFSNLYLKRKTEASKAAFLSRKLTIKDIQEMDVEGNGAVSYTEFLEFMLVTMGKVEMSDIKELEQLYKKLDTDDSKSLNIQDLVTTANGRSLD
jgi:Ca2+-binding EF-hand superfamily protein